MNDTSNDDLDLAKSLATKFDTLRSEIGKRVVGQHDVVELLLLALLSKGHGLFVGVPGLAKTLLIQTLSEGLGLEFSRIQFTPDLMPSDITGTDVLEEDKSSGQRAFRFLKGPLFSNVVLADEINRTPPKTQAALLQAMQERTVSAGGKTYELPPPFLVFATQNPIEQEGTYPLPEAQLDRFMFMIDVGYPTFEDEIEIVKRTTSVQNDSVNAVLNAEDIVRYQALVRRVPVAEHVVRYAVKLVRATRPAEGDAPEFHHHQRRCKRADRIRSRGRCVKARAPFSADEIMGIRSLEVRARTVVDAVLTGAHKSRRFGAWILQRRWQARFVGSRTNKTTRPR